MLGNWASRLSARASAFSESERSIPPWGDRGGRWRRKSHNPLSHPPQRLIFRIEGFECSTPLAVSPLVEPAGHRVLQAFDLGFQSGVPGELPLHSQPVFHAISSSGRYRRPWVVTRATLGIWCCQSLQNGVEEVLSACVDCHLVVKLRIERN